MGYELSTTIYHYTFSCKTWYLRHIWLLKRDIFDTLHMWSIALTIHFPCETRLLRYSLHGKHDIYNTLSWKHDMYDTFYILNLAARYMLHIKHDIYDTVLHLLDDAQSHVVRGSHAHLHNRSTFFNLQFTQKKGDNKFIGKHISSKSKIASYAVQYISVARLIHASSCSCNVETIRCIK
jgi:hypothetical protein